MESVADPLGPSRKTEDTRESTAASKSLEPCTFDRVHWGRMDASGHDGRKICCIDNAAEGKARVSMLCPGEIGNKILVIPRVVIRDRWYLPVKVNSQGGEFLVDSGATTTLVTKEFYDTLRNKPAMVPTTIRVNVADGDPIQTEGFATFPLEIKDRIYMITCLIVHGLEGHDDGVLGADFMYLHRCNLDWSGKFSIEEGRDEVRCKLKGLAEA